MFRGSCESRAVPCDFLKSGVEDFGEKPLLPRMPGTAQPDESRSAPTVTATSSQRGSRSARRSHPWRHAQDCSVDRSMASHNRFARLAAPPSRSLFLLVCFGGEVGLKTAQRPSAGSVTARGDESARRGSPPKASRAHRPALRVFRCHAGHHVNSSRVFRPTSIAVGFP